MTKAINQTAINAAIKGALQAAHVYGARIEELKSLLRGIEESQASNVITPAVAKFYGIEAVEGKRGLTFEGGPLDGEKATKPYMAAKAARTRLLRAVYGEEVSRAVAQVKIERVRVNALQAAIAGLTKAEARAHFERALEAAFA